VFSLVELKARRNIIVDKVRVFIKIHKVEGYARASEPEDKLAKLTANFFVFVETQTL
jgi:hypothetical protein